MNIVIAAEKDSIASVLADHVSHPVSAGDIVVTELADTTGRFRVDWRLQRFTLEPDGTIDDAE